MIASRRLLPLLVLASLAPAAPAAARDKPPCRFPGFHPVYFEGRAAVLQGRPGTELSCDIRTGRAYSLTPGVEGYRRVLDPRRRSKTLFALAQSAGRWLLYRQVTPNYRLMRLDIKTGSREVVYDGVPGQEAVARDGSVAYVRPVDGESRLVLRTPDGTARTLAQAKTIRAVSLRTSKGRPLVTWLDPDGLHAAGGGLALCDTPAAYATDGVRVVKTPDGTFACDTRTGQARSIGGPGATVNGLASAGSFLAYEDITNAGNTRFLRLLDVETGRVRELGTGTRQQGLSVAGLQANGSIAYVQRFFAFSPDQRSGTDLLRWSVAAPPVTLSSDAQPDSLALAPSGRTYWVAGDGTVRSDGG